MAGSVPPVPRKRPIAALKRTRWSELLASALSPPNSDCLGSVGQRIFHRQQPQQLDADSVSHSLPAGSEHFSARGIDEQRGTGRDSADLHILHR